MADFLAWSHSRLKMFKECPGKLWHCAVAPKGHPDRVPYVESQAQRDGKEIDLALSQRISKGTPLPAKFAAYEGMIQVVLDSPGTKLAQVEVALDQELRPCGYRDWNSAWVRAVYDVAIINGTYAFLGDWKNGKVWIDESQLRLAATIGFHQYREVEIIDTSFVWLQHGITSDETYTRRDLPDMWQTFLPDVERMQVYHKSNHWPKTPSARACGWCEVNAAGKCPVAATKFKGKR